MTIRPAAEGADYTECPTGESTDWRAQARCRDYDPEVFYPFGTELQAKSAEAIHVCHQCPVEIECRNWALTHGERFGVWGGMSEIDREEFWTGHRRHFPRSA
jgi:WhiB family redox-sensing transcriptional regulator